MSSPGRPSTHRRASVYQIDFTAVASGKRIASSKRRVRWRFGFANPEALAAGETGTACRGEEHDVTLVWSITSGKRLVLADGQEVHFSNSRSGIFDFSWTMRGNHVLKIVAHASPPLSATPGFRQYDFFIDGQSFFSFPKLYRLGLAAGDPRAQRPPAGPIGLAEGGRSSSRNYSAGGGGPPRRSGSGIASIEAPHNPDEEEAYLQEAIRQSIEDSTHEKDDKPSGGGTTDLLDFAAPVAASAPALPPSTSDPFAMPAVSAPAALPPSTTTTDPWAAAPAPALPPSTSDPFGAQPAPTPPVPGPLAITAGPATTSNGYGPSYGSAPGQSAAYPSPAPPVDAGYGGTPSPYGAPPQQAGYSAPPAPEAGYGAPATTPFGAPPPVDASSAQAQAPQPAAAAPWSAPVPTASTQPPYGQPYEQAGPPVVVAPSFGSPQGTQPETPSTLGFASPPADFSGFSGQQPDSTPAPSQPMMAPEQAPTPAGQPILSMNALSLDSGLVDGQVPAADGTLADQAYSKLVNMDTFSLVSKKDEQRSNPFESAGSTTIGGTKSLADMQKTKSAPAKEIMKTPTPAPGTMVVSSQQTGNWGGQYGAPMQQPMMQQPAYGQAPAMGQPGQMPPQPQYGQAPPQQYGQAPPPPQQPQYGQAPPQQPFGQAPPMQQSFGQAPPQQSYGQPPQPGMNQPPFGQQPAPQGYNY